MIEVSKGGQYEKNTNKYNGMMYGMCIGVGGGTALGMVFNQTILGLAIGLGGGMFVGSFFTNKHNGDIEQ